MRLDPLLDAPGDYLLAPREVKGIKLMSNSIHNGWRFEDVWLDNLMLVTMAGDFSPPAGNSPTTARCLNRSVPGTGRSRAAPVSGGAGVEVGDPGTTAMRIGCRSGFGGWRVPPAPLPSARTSSWAVLDQALVPRRARRRSSRLLAVAAPGLEEVAGSVELPAS